MNTTPNTKRPQPSSRPAIAMAERGRAPRLLRELLVWAGSGEWRVRGLRDGRDEPKVTSPGDLSWELLKQCVSGEVGIAVLDLDDPISRYWKEAELTPCITYSERHDRADLAAKNLTVLPDRTLRFEVLTRGKLERVYLSPKLCSLYEALNIMACALAAGVPVGTSAAFFNHLYQRKKDESCYHL